MNFIQKYGGIIAVVAIVIAIIGIFTGGSTIRTIQQITGSSTNYGSIGLSDMSPVNQQDISYDLSGGGMIMAASTTPCSFFTGSRRSILISFQFRYIPTAATSSSFRLATSTLQNATTTTIAVWSAVKTSNTTYNGDLIASTTNDATNQLAVFPANTYVNFGVEGPFDVSNTNGYCGIQIQYLDK